MPPGFRHVGFLASQGRTLYYQELVAAGRFTTKTLVATVEAIFGAVWIDSSRVFAKVGLFRKGSTLSNKMNFVAEKLLEGSLDKCLRNIPQLASNFSYFATGLLLSFLRLRCRTFIPLINLKMLLLSLACFYASSLSYGFLPALSEKISSLSVVVVFGKSHGPLRALYFYIRVC